MKKFIKLLIIASILFLFSTYVFAANTTVVTDQNQIITITGLDADWDASTETKTKDLLRNGILKIWRIIFYPAATGDDIILRDDGLDAAEFFDSGVCADRYDTRTIDAPGGQPWEVNPVLDYSDCTISTGSKVMIYIEKPKP